MQLVYRYTEEAELEQRLQRFVFSRDGWGLYKSNRVDP
jgi:hypothetical protein